MASKINVMEPKPARVAPNAAARPLPGSTSGPGSGSSSEPAAAATDVQLTGAARGLAALEESLRTLPAVDELRVAAVRQRIEDGSYEIDPQRVADRLLRLEADLARAQAPGPNSLK